MVSLETIYKRTQLSAKVHKLNYLCEAKATTVCADILLKNCTTSKGRLGKAIQLGLASGIANGMALSGSPAYDTGLSAYALPAFVPSKWQTVSLRPFGATPLTFVTLATAAAVGSGAPSSQPNERKSPGERLLAEVLQYGIIGLSQAIAIRGWNHYAGQQKHLAAKACLVAAIAIAIPLEVARTGLAASVLLTSSAFMALVVLFSCGYNVGQWAFNRDVDPGSYAFGTERARDYNKFRTGQAPPKMHGFKAHSTKGTDPTENQRSVQGDIIASFSVFNPVLLATTPGEARQALTDLKVDRIWVTNTFNQLNKDFDSFKKRKELGQGLSKTLVMVEIDKIFSCKVEKEHGPLWAVKNYFNIARVLHPDKLQVPGKLLPPDIDAMATACFRMLTSLRALHSTTKI